MWSPPTAQRRSRVSWVRTDINKISQQTGRASLISTARMRSASSSLVRRHPARLRVVSCTPRPGRTVTASHLGEASQTASAIKAAAAAVHSMWLRSSA